MREIMTVERYSHATYLRTELPAGIKVAGSDSLKLDCLHMALDSLRDEGQKRLTEILDKHQSHATDARDLHDLCEWLLERQTALVTHFSDSSRLDYDVEPPLFVEGAAS